MSPLNVADFAEWIGIVRDGAFLFLIVVAVLLVLMLYQKVSKVLDSAKRTIKSAEEIVTTVSGKMVKPVAVGSGAAFGLGKMAAFVLGFSKRRRNKGRSRDEERKRDREGERNDGE